MWGTKRLAKTLQRGAYFQRSFVLDVLLCDKVRFMPVGVTRYLGVDCDLLADFGLKRSRLSELRSLGVRLGCSI